MRAQNETQSALTGAYRIATILRAINDVDPATITAIANHTGIPRSATRRYLNSLIDLGYAVQDARKRRYLPTSRTWELSHGAARWTRIGDAVLPLLTACCRQIGWPVTFCTIRNAQVSVLAHTDAVSPHLERPRSPYPFKPLLGRASGHVLLTFCEQELRANILRVAVAEDPELFLRAGLTGASLGRLLDDIRDAGFAISKPAGQAYKALAVPIPIDGEPGFSLSASFDQDLHSEADAIAAFLPRLRSCAAMIADRLSGTGWQNMVRPINSTDRQALARPHGRGKGEPEPRSSADLVEAL